MAYNIEYLKKEYIGKEFGWLTVLDVYRENSILYFKCQCKCGVEKDIPKKQIMSGNDVSCGCYKYSEEKNLKIKRTHQTKSKLINEQRINQLKEKYVGKTYNFLTITDVFQGKHHDECWCKCKCGKEKQIVLYRVVKGYTKSCGCINQEIQKEYWKSHKDQRAEMAKKYSRWCNDNPDKVKEKTFKRLQYYKDHQNELTGIGKRHAQWYKDNPDKVKEQVSKYKKWCADNKELSKARAKNSRLANIKDRSYLIEFKDIIHPDDYKRLMNNESTTCRTKCPICGKYEEHSFNNTFQCGDFKRGSPPKCIGCRSILTSSKAEQEIEDFIKSFYKGDIVRNTREIIQPLELDIYVPEKRIAVEFNGDYWHSEEFKDKDYHLNKFLKCREKGILLVSVFESEWNNRKKEIKYYLEDLFEGKENYLSFSECRTMMNNNYPSPNIVLNSSIIEDYYQFNESKVFTCGYTQLKST